jgi:hypothetical protein
MSTAIKSGSQNTTKQAEERQAKSQSNGLSTRKLLGNLRPNLTQPECSGPNL